jgi:hypothetical protein
MRKQYVWIIYSVFNEFTDFGRRSKELYDIEDKQKVYAHRK